VRLDLAGGAWGSHQCRAMGAAAGSPLTPTPTAGVMYPPRNGGGRRASWAGVVARTRATDRKQSPSSPQCFLLFISFFGPRPENEATTKRT